MKCSHLDSLVDKKGKSEEKHYIHARWSVAT
jgi:hypothetical protein